LGLVDDATALPVVAALADDVRRDLYAYVRREGRGVTRDDAAAHAGISRNLAAFHLDKLVAAGLLEARTGGDGEGRIGRPPKTYRPSDLELQVSIPAQRYEFAAEMLLGAAVAAERDGTPLGEALLTEAHRRGSTLGEEARGRIRRGPIGPERALSLVEGVAVTCGFEPERSDGQQVRLRNCPYRRLARSSRQLICGMNAAFFAGAAEGVGGRVRAELVPWEGHCCVKLQA
jgi:predicted ArsR family transcriptional regulator